MDNKVLNSYIGMVADMAPSSEIIDCRGMDDDNIIKIFLNKLNFFNEEYRDALFYAGIAQNIEKRDSDHGLAGHILCVDLGVDKIHCGKIEKKIHDKLKVYIGKEGSDSAGNGAKDETRYVYLIPRCLPFFMPENDRFNLNEIQSGYVSSLSPWKKAQ